MKTMRNLYVAVLVLASAFANAQNFEGVITMNTSNESLSETATLTWYLKGGSSRMEIDSKAGDHNTEYVVIADGKGMDMIAEGQVTSVPQTAMRVDLSTQQLLCLLPLLTDQNANYAMCRSLTVLFL